MIVNFKALCLLSLSEKHISVKNLILEAKNASIPPLGKTEKPYSNSSSSGLQYNVRIQ